MKPLKIQILLALLFVGMGNAAIAADLNGMWKSDTETMIVYQDGDTIKVLCSIDYNAQRAILYGEGTVKDKVVSLRTRISPSTLPSGWEERGTLTVTVSPDGNSLTGKWRTESGSWSGPANFGRLRP
ncbi:MAG: hypothetical protein GTN81_02005 [Proteobacteria bacterium]|nr:hypothetical protein [Pseudomonadota bacterium]